MFAQPFQEKGDYSGETQRPVNYSQSLWRVNDTELHKPGERFLTKDESPYLEAIIEQGIMGPLESAPIPKGLVDFIKDATRTFGVISSKHTSIEDVASKVMTLLDFTEPYYLFVGSAVQLNGNQLKYTYRHKGSGSILQPEEIECFNVVPGFGFDQYRGSCDFIRHPEVQAVLRGESVQHRTENRPVTKDDVLKKLSEILYGDHPSLLSVIEEWLFTHFSDLRYNGINLTDEEILQLDSEQQLDMKFWTVATISVLMWLRSPYAIRFLAEYHPVYQAVLYWDSKADKVKVVPESGGEVIVNKWDVYTHLHLLVETNSPPGTCESCKQSLHCTKYINAQALFHPVCSCGKLVPVEETEFRGHDWKNGDCRAYLEQHKPFNAFVCQRCIQMALDGRDPLIARCQRTVCPATQCPHHAGGKAYIHELTRRRTLMLTHH